MANSEHLTILKQGSSYWNSWRAEHPSITPDISEADLRRTWIKGQSFSGEELRGTAAFSQASTGTGLAKLVEAGPYLRMINFKKADLRAANLSGAELSDADLSGADLGNANLATTSLTRAKLETTNLRGANLRHADCRWANVSRAVMCGADLTKTIVGWTNFGDVDLGSVKGLASVRHEGPSTIGIDTVYRSQGKIPEAFLRGAGVPEQFITYARSLVGQAIEFYSCFISYSSDDQAFTERLHADLRSRNLRVWFAPEDLKIGDRFQERIEESIRLYDKVMVVLSEASVQSRWVEREINAAREREDREKRTVLFPIRIDDAVMYAPEPWAADIRRTRHIGDFRLWKDHDSYQKALERLLRDLRAEAAPPSPL